MHKSPSPSRAKGRWLVDQGRSPDLAPERVNTSETLRPRRPSRRFTSGVHVDDIRRHHSGGTVRVSHPIPYSPHSDWGTLNLSY